MGYFLQTKRTIVIDVYIRHESSTDGTHHYTPLCSRHAAYHRGPTHIMWTFSAKNPNIFHRSNSIPSNHISKNVSSY